MRCQRCFETIMVESFNLFCAELLPLVSLFFFGTPNISTDWNIRIWGNSNISIPNIPVVVSIWICGFLFQLFCWAKFLEIFIGHCYMVLKPFRVVSRLKFTDMLTTLGKCSSALSCLSRRVDVARTVHIVLSRPGTIQGWKPKSLWPRMPF